MNMEQNKILAAFLVAGIVAFACGIVGRGLVHSHKLEKNAYEIEAVEVVAAGGAAAPAEPEPIDGLMAEADIAQGEKIGKVCASCHTFGAGDPNKIGPHLFAVVGRAKGAVGDFAYSDAMKEAGGNWDVEALNAFLWKPRKAMPGTKMTYAGLKKPEDRAALIKWLQLQR